MNSYQTQIKIILSVFGDNFDPNYLSEYIGVNPTDQWNKGDSVPLRKGLIRQENAWEYSTEFIETLFLNEVSEIIVTIFEEKSLILYNYIKQNELSVKIDIVLEIIENNVPALTFNRKFLEIINLLQSEVDIDMYLIQ